MGECKNYHATNETANGIAQDLGATKNSHVIELVLVINENLLTVSGARIIANGLKQSNIKKLDIRRPTGDTFEPNGNVLQPILEVAILHRHIEELRLDVSLNDDIAKTLTAILLSDDGHALQTLLMSIGPNLTLDTAQQLATGLCHANVKCLTLEGINNRWFRNHKMSAASVASATKSLEKLVLEDELDDAAAIQIGDALVGNTNLQSFTLRLDNLSVDAAVRLANGISRSHIVYLTLSETVPFEISAHVEDIMYVNGVARSPTIQHLSIGYGFCGTPGLSQCLSKLCTLTTSRSVVVKNVPAMIMGMKTNTSHLTSLVLRQPMKELQDILAFCAALPRLTSLTDLAMQCKLAYVQVDDKTKSSLDCVVESRRCIQTTAAEQLMVAVANHPCLVRLTLDGSYDVGFAGLEMIGRHLCNNINLQTLRLNPINDEYTNLSDKNRRRMIPPACQRACQALVAGVQSNWHLHVLTGCEDSFPPKVADEINFYLDLNKSGRHLLHDRDSKNKVPTGLWCHVLAKCGNNKADFVYYHLREQPTLLLAAGMGRNKLDCKVYDVPSVSVPAGTKHCRKE